MVFQASRGLKRAAQTLQVSNGHDADEDADAGRSNTSCLDGCPT